MGLLKDVTRLQPSINSLASQIGLFSQQKAKEEMGLARKTILDETLEEINAIEGKNADTLVNVASDPLAYKKPLANAVMRLNAIGDSETAKNVDSWFSNLIGAQNAQSNAISAQAQATNATINAEKNKREGDEYARKTKILTTKVRDILNLPQGQDFTVEMVTGKGTTKRVNLADMTAEEAGLTGDILAPYMKYANDENLINKQLQTNKESAKSELIQRVNGNFNRVWSSVDAKNELPEDAYYDLQNMLLAQIRKDGQISQAEAVKSIVSKHKITKVEDVRKLRDIAGQVFSASTDVMTRTNTSEKNADLRSPWLDKT